MSAGGWFARWCCAPKCVAAVAAAALTTVSLAQVDNGGQGILRPIDRAQTIADFKIAYPGAVLHERAGRIARVYGDAFSIGATAGDSADLFRTSFAGMWGVPPQDLLPIGPFDDGHHLQPIMYERAADGGGTYKFTGAYYMQSRDGVEVFRSRLMLLARNEPNNPIVLASADLRDIGGFRVPQGAAAALNTAPAFAAARAIVGRNAALTQPRLVIWAGVDDQVFAPVLAFEFIAEGNLAQPGYQKILFLADAATGAILYQEDQVVHAAPRGSDLSGNVSGLATQGIAADTCGPEVATPMPYAQLKVGASLYYADVNGNYVIPEAGEDPVMVESAIRGQYFLVNNQAGAESVIINSGVAPGPLSFLHNSANSSEQNRAEVNGYIHANIVRDYALAYNPAYPTIATQTNFPVNVNINSTCNAFYNGTSINFYLAGGSCTNTAVSTVVYHEYGHHMVNRAGSGQGAYGEGQSDVVAVLVTNDPRLGLGFQGSCATPLRNANNTCQYDLCGCSSCGSEIHACGRLISGCVWSLRNELLATNPSTYRDILSNLAINSMFLHTGSLIDNSITLDYLVLDDDNTNLSDGTPHFAEINEAFSDHGLAPPPQQLVVFSFPDGLPTMLAPSGGTTMRVVVAPDAAVPQPGTGELHVNTGSGFFATPMTPISANEYDAVFPAVPCGTQVSFYVSVETVAAQQANAPLNAPADAFTALGAAGIGAVVFNDNFETNLGWTVTNTPSLTDGAWNRGVPVGGGDRGDPPTDADGSGQCFLTDNAPGNSDVDGGGTTLTSPTMDASTGLSVLAYWRWYDNSFGNAPGADTFVVEVSDDNGAAWVNLEAVGPCSEETRGGWVYKEVNLDSLATFDLTNQFRVRFTASDLGEGSVVEAGVDGVRLQRLNCLVGDLNGDGAVDVADLLALIGAWGACPAPPAACVADLNGDDTVDVNDLLILIGAWSP